jgi:ATP-dependent helicase/nuclease subunit A
MIADEATTFAGGPPLTDAQGDAVRREGHTLIAAGAGSGKTTTLVEKIVWALGDAGGTGRGCELGDIAAITFTNAAAADFKRKLRGRIRGVADWYAAREEHEQADRWRERIYEVDRARIGTIHSFCGQLLREFAFRFGIDPAFTILDDADAALLRGDCVATVVQRAFRDDPETMALLDQFRVSDVESLVGELVARGDVVGESLDVWFHDGAPRLEELRRKIDQQHDAFDCDPDEGVWREFDPLAARLSGMLLGMARAAREALDSRLDDERALDYDALIARTRKALARNSSVLDAVRGRLRWLFVDEFQDTDRAQLDIAYQITGFDDWMRRTPPWLCIVGDPKQSIYRFRRADVSLWQAVEQDFVDRNIQPIQLDTNFRSRKPIIAYVNATFEGLMGEGPEAVREAGHEVAYHPLVAHREAPGDNDIVELLTPAAGRDGTADERREADAEAIVARMHAMLGEDLIWDDEASAFREVRWSDFALLFRARTGLPILETVLRRHNVPYYVASSTGFFGRREIRDLRLLLTALADPRDDVAWLGLLRSPFVGLTDEAIMRYRATAPRAPLSRSVYSDAGTADPVLRRAREWLRPAREMRDRVTVTRLLDFCIERSAYAAQLLAGDSGAIALGNVRNLLRIAEGRPASTVSEFVTFMEQRDAEGADDGDALSFTARDNVVTLSTVHGAKGLEWPIVFLADVDRDIVRKTGAPRLFVDPAAGIGLRITAPDAADKTPAVSGAWECLRRRDELLTEAEEKRLWYVATTRARDRLVLCASTDDVEETTQIWWPDAEHDPSKVTHWLLRALDLQDGYCMYGGRYTAGETVQSPRPLPKPALPPLPTMDDLAATRGVVLARGDLQLAGIPAPILLPRRSATELMLLAKNPAEYRNRYVVGLRERRITPVTGTPIVSARIMGDVLHAALDERLDGEELDAFLEHELIDRTGESAGSPRLRAARAKLFELVERSTSNPVVARLLDAPESEGELSFTWMVRSEGGGHAVMRGAIDLVARVDGRLEIMDFKSHEISAGHEEPTARDYDVQMQVYAAALAALAGADPVRFSFFFPSSGREAARALGTSAVSSAMIRVRQLVDEASDAQTGVTVAPGMSSLMTDASQGVPGLASR